MLSALLGNQHDQQLAVDNSDYDHLMQAVTEQVPHDKLFRILRAWHYEPTHLRLPYRIVYFRGRHVYLCEDSNGDAGTALILGAWHQLSAAEQAVLVGLAIVVRVLPHVHQRSAL